MAKKVYKHRKISRAVVAEHTSEYAVSVASRRTDAYGRTLLTIKEASEWASEFLKKNVTASNISYLIQYGKITKHGENGTTFVDRNELVGYYNSFYGRREIEWKQQLGEDIDWRLSFDYLKESDTTKHVHRLHPYKGKFIPQLVEYFLDAHTDEFKNEVYFRPGDVVLDPFCGSGTTLVQANELGMHAIGIDVSAFNTLISNVKIGSYDITELQKESKRIADELKEFVAESNVLAFEAELLNELRLFNTRYFPSPEYKRKVRNSEIREDIYGRQKEREFLPVYNNLVKKHGIQLKQTPASRFLDKWYLQQVREELEFVFQRIKKIKNSSTKKVLSIMLSRTIRSCRATTHSDLATLVEPISSTYYCSKHGKICKPLFSIVGWWERYYKDTISRLLQFGKLKTNTYQLCVTGDSRKMDIFSELHKRHENLAGVAKTKKIKGIFSSPPYVGLIDYHEQHAYAYDLFGFQRNDEFEIGRMNKGTGKEARELYVQGIADVLNNCKQYLAPDFNILLVANDKNNLYPLIAEKADLQIVKQFKRPVLNRTEKDKGAYSESIFHMKEA